MTRQALVPKKMDHEGAVTALKSALAVLTELRGWDVETSGRGVETLGPDSGNQDRPAIRCPSRWGYGPHGCPTPVRYYDGPGKGPVSGSA